jgi:hypothetical protein
MILIKIRLLKIKKKVGFFVYKMYQIVWFYKRNKLILDKKKANQTKNNQLLPNSMSYIEGIGN